MIFGGIILYQLIDIEYNIIDLYWSIAENRKKIIEY